MSKKHYKTRKTHKEKLKKEKAEALKAEQRGEKTDELKVNKTDEKVQKPKELATRIILSIGSFIILIVTNFLLWVFGVLLGKLSPFIASISTLVCLSIWLVFIVWKIFKWKIFIKKDISLHKKILICGVCVILVFVLGVFPFWNVLNDLFTIPQKSIVTFPRFINPNQKVTFSYGNISFDFTISELETGKNTFFNIIYVDGVYHPFLVYMEDDNLYVDITTPGNDELGIPALKIYQNRIIGIPSNWDMNFLNGYAEELVNEKQEPILQIIYDNPYHIVINGFITYPGGFDFTDGISTYLGHLPDKPSLKRIFKYPYSEFPNILDKGKSKTEITIPSSSN
jgi:hypothetical protein